MRGFQTHPFAPTGHRGASLVALVICALLVAAGMPEALAAESDAELNAQKEFWQARYTKLLDDADMLRETIERERELYADANRRNYRRGNKRHRHRTAMLEAEAKLEVVERELAALPDEARRAGALPGWLYEVELERE